MIDVITGQYARSRSVFSQPFHNRKFLRPRRLLAVSEDRFNLVIEFYTLNYICSQIFPGSKCPHGLNQTDGRKYSQGLACRYAHASNKTSRNQTDHSPSLHSLPSERRRRGDRKGPWRILTREEKDLAPSKRTNLLHLFPFVFVLCSLLPIY